MLSCCLSRRVQLSEKQSSEAALVKHEGELRQQLNQKLLELGQVMKAVEVLKSGKEEQQGERAG